MFQCLTKIMKTLIQSLAFACLSLCLVSNAGAEDAQKSAEKMAEKKAEMNHIAMQNGKMVIMKDGETTELKETITLNDGTQVMADGSYLEQGKTEKKMLKEGEAINWKGKVTDHDKILKDIEKHKEKKAEKAAKEAEKATENNR